MTRALARTGALLALLLLAAACDTTSANPCAGITDPTEQKACHDRQVQLLQQRLQSGRPPGGR